MKKKKKMSVVLAVTVLIIGVLLIFDGGKKGSAAYDPDAVRADGLYISLDKDKWDLENVENHVITTSGDVTDKVKLTSVRSFPYEKSNSLRFQIEHCKLNSLTYEEYCDLSYGNEQPQPYETLFDGEISIEKHTVRRIIYRMNGEIVDGMIIGKGHYIYVLTFWADEENYEKNKNGIQASIDSIHIKSFR